MKDTIKLNLANVKMIAHKGVSGLERENTNAAFVAAGNRTYFGVETDVHRTLDGRYLLIHDDNTQSVAGVSFCIEETDFDTLRAIHMNDLDGNPRVDLVFPALSEYVNLCKKYDKDCVLEFKNPFAPEDIDNMIDIVRSCGWLERTIFISGYLSNCVYVREHFPAQRVQILTVEFKDDLIDILIRNRLDLGIDYTAINEEQVKLCHKNGIAVNVWTVDNPEDAKRLASWGVDYITTNILE